MKDKIRLVLAGFGLGLYVSGLMCGLMYMITDISNKDFKPLAVLVAICMFWFAIAVSELFRWLSQKIKNPRKQ